MSISIIEIVILVIALIFVLSGLKRGLMKQVFSTFGWLIAIVAAIFLCSPVADFAKGINEGAIENTVTESVNGFISEKLGEIATTAVSNENIDEVVGNALSNLNLPVFLHEPIITAIKSSNLLEEGVVSLTDYLTPAIVRIIFVVACFIVIFILALILISIIGAFLIKLFDGGVLGLANRLLGAAIGLVIALLFVNVVTFAMSFVVTWVPGIQEFINSDLLADGKGFGIVRYFYDNNWISFLVASGWNFEALIENVKATASDLF